MFSQKRLSEVDLAEQFSNSTGHSPISFLIQKSPIPLPDHLEEFFFCLLGPDRLAVDLVTIQSLSCRRGFPPTRVPLRPRRWCATALHRHAHLSLCPAVELASPQPQSANAVPICVVPFSNGRGKLPRIIVGPIPKAPATSLTAGLPQPPETA